MHSRSGIRRVLLGRGHEAFNTFAIQTLEVRDLKYLLDPEEDRNCFNDFLQQGWFDRLTCLKLTVRICVASYHYY